MNNENLKKEIQIHSSEAVVKRSKMAEKAVKPPEYQEVLRVR